MNRVVALLCLLLLTNFTVRTGELRDCGCGKSGVKSRILDGTNVPEGQFPTVGKVGDANGMFCTGTLIAPNVVLCAAHCVADDTGSQLLSDTQGRFILGGATYSTRKIVIHPSYKGFVGAQDGQYDVSVLILSTSVPNVAPSPMFRTVPTVGTILTLVGFGELGSGAAGGNGKFPGDGTVQTGSTTIQRISNAYLHWTFDPGESDTAQGDSGGPAFIDQAGVSYLAGITSGGSGTGFGFDSYDTRVDVVADWVDSIIAAQGSELIISGPLASRNPAAPGEAVQFSAMGVSGVSFAWNFGDGTPDASGENVVHTYNAVGTYVVTLKATQASSGKIATPTLGLIVTNDFVADGGVVQVTSSRKRFILQFANPANSRFGIVLDDPAFTFADRSAFEQALLNSSVQVFFGSMRADTFQIAGSTTFGQLDSRLVWNYSLGQVRYRVRSAEVGALLQKLGAENADTEKVVSVPFFLLIKGVRYGGVYQFAYKAQAARTGTGK